MSALALLVLGACQDSRPVVAGADPAPLRTTPARPAPAAPVVRPAIVTAAVAGAGAPAHDLYASKGIACDACHLCGARSPDGHDQPWMDRASAGFHASAANAGLAECQRCHGPELDGIGGSTSISCSVCHGATWRTDCVLCHGGTNDRTGAPPRTTWGNGADPVRVGAHAAHLGATRGLSRPVACEACHVVPADALDPGHADGDTAEVTFTGLAVAQTVATPAWDRTLGTCTNTYCHGSTLRGGGTNQAPAWAGGAAEVVCGSCHLTPPPPPHPRTQICDNCHPGYGLGTVDPATHINGVVEATNLTCSSCHGDNSRVLVSQADPLAIAAPPYGSRGETDPTSRSVGQHQAHVSRGDGIALPNKCRYCHAVPTTFDHANGLSEVRFGSLATMDGAAATFDGTTCSDTYCHGATLGRGGTDHSPSWTNPTPVTCTTCHGAPPPDPHPQDSDCIRCHPGYTATTVRQATHVNGVSDFPTGCNACHDVPPSTGEHFEHLHERVRCDACHAGYTTTTANPTLHRNARQDVTLAGWDPVRRTCSNISCHGGEYWGRTGVAARQSCNQCHGVPPASGEHFEHSEYACSRCHGTGYSSTTVGATHMNDTVDVPLAFYDRATHTCSRACHGSERWGTPVPVTPNCDNCHGFPPPIPHPQDSACQTCHPSMTSSGVLTSTHNNGTLDISGQGCASCHGFPPASTRSGGVHPTDSNCYGCHPTTVDSSNQILPNGTHNDGHVQVGGGGVGTYGCQTCHGDQSRVAVPGADPNVSSAPPFGTRGETEPTTRAVGAHLAHANGGAASAPLACTECHVVPTAMDHANGQVVLTFGARARMGGAQPIWDPATLTCSAVYCHGATLGAGGTHLTPTWTGGAAEGACGSCHGAPPLAPHPASGNCGGCHDGYTTTTVNPATHVNGSVEVSALGCSSCHGSATNAAPPYGTAGETATTARAVGAHQTHLVAGTLSNPIACSECHALPTTADHSDGTVQLAFGPLASAQGATASFDPATVTCNTYCHGQFPGGNLLDAPVWTIVDGSQVACGTCHGTPPPAPHTTSTACGSCHDGYTQTTVNRALHVDGKVDAKSPHAAGWADETQHGYQANLTGLAGCQGCHGADLSGGTSGGGCSTCHATAGFAAWDTSCTFCHGNRSTGRQSPPVDVQGRSVATNVSVGRHDSHVGSAIANVACDACHPARSASVVSDAAHVDGDGVAEVAFGAIARTGGVTPAYTRTSPTSASCASTYCHGNFSGGRRATVAWTGTTQVYCSSCHGAPPSTGRHSYHSGRSCGDCHPGYTTTAVNKGTHVNGSKQVGNRITSWSASTRSCYSTCHGRETW